VYQKRTLAVTEANT